MVAGVEVLESAGEDVAQRVAVELVLAVEVGRDAEIVAVVVGNAACISGSCGLHLRVDEVGIGLNVLVGIVPIVHAEGALEGEIAQRRERELL